MLNKIVRSLSGKVRSSNDERSTHPLASFSAMEASRHTPSSTPAMRGARGGVVPSSPGSILSLNSLTVMPEPSLKRGSAYFVSVDDSVHGGKAASLAGGSIRGGGDAARTGRTRLNSSGAIIAGQYKRRRSHAEQGIEYNWGTGDERALLRSFLFARTGPIYAASRAALLLLVLWCALTYPFRLAFGESAALRAVDYLADAAFLLDVAVGFRTGFVERSRLVLEPRRMARHYLAHRFLQDALAAVPSLLLLPERLMYGASLEPNPFLWIRLLRLARIGDLLSGLRRLERSVRVPFALARAVRLVAVVALAVHWAACATFGVFSGDEAPGAQLDLGGARSPATQYARALYWSAAALTGAADHVARSDGELLFSAAVFAAGFALVAWTIGHTASLSASSDADTARFRSQMRSLQERFERDAYPKPLRDRLTEYFVLMNQRRTEADTMLDQLPYSLQAEVVDHTHRALAEQCALLEGCEGRFVQALAVLMRRAVFTPGQYVTRVDDPSREMYIIGGGEVEVWIEDICHPRRVIGRGQCFGEISMLFGVKQTQTAFTHTHCTLYVIGREKFEELGHTFIDQVARMRQNALKMGAASLGRSFEGVRAAIRRLEEEQLMRLCYFAGFNDVENMARMLDGGLDVNAADYDGRTALHISASEGHVKATELLLRRGADAGRRDRWGGTAMQNAVKFGHDAVAAILRQHGARLTDADVGDALYVAASEGDIETLQRYVRNGANPNVCDYDKRTALHLAASEGQLAAVEILLKMGADIDARDRFGCTPLDDALRGGYEDVANLLRERQLSQAFKGSGAPRRGSRGSNQVTSRSSEYETDRTGSFGAPGRPAQPASGALPFIPFNFDSPTASPRRRPGGPRGSDSEDEDEGPAPPPREKPASSFAIPVALPLNVPEGAETLVSKFTPPGSPRGTPRAESKEAGGAAGAAAPVVMRQGTRLNRLLEEDEDEAPSRPASARPASRAAALRRRWKHAARRVMGRLRRERRRGPLPSSSSESGSRGGSAERGGSESGLRTPTEMLHLRVGGVLLPVSPQAAAALAAAAAEHAELHGGTPRKATEAPPQPPALALGPSDSDRDLSSGLAHTLRATARSARGSPPPGAGGVGPASFHSLDSMCASAAGAAAGAAPGSSRRVVEAGRTASSSSPTLLIDLHETGRPAGAAAARPEFAHPASLPSFPGSSSPPRGPGLGSYRRVLGPRGSLASRPGSADGQSVALSGAGEGPEAGGRRLIIVASEDVFSRFMHYVGVRERVVARRTKRALAGLDLVTLSDGSFSLSEAGSRLSNQEA
eukprot:tig00000073_g1731.t1